MLGALIKIRHLAFVEVCICGFSCLLGSENDKYATQCPYLENHLPRIVEAANACITFEVMIHHP